MTARLWYTPAATDTTFDSPSTSTGVLREIVVPSPSCPTPFHPDAHTVPSDRRNSVW